MSIAALAVILMTRFIKSISERFLSRSSTRSKYHLHFVQRIFETFLFLLFGSSHRGLENTENAASRSSLLLTNCITRTHAYVPRHTPQFSK